MKKTILFLGLILSVTANAACKNPMANAPRGTTWKECKQNPRNTAADQYLLTDTGDYYAYVRSINRLCQITGNVTDFKVSQHPTDIATTYYTIGEKNRGSVKHLWYTKDVRVANDCPRSEKHELVSNVKKWTVSSDTNSDVVNAALNTSGRFTAWNWRFVVSSENNVTDYAMNPNYSRKGAPFSSYVLFILKSNQKIVKVKGEKSGDRYVPETETTERYESIADFKNKNGIKN